jgi:acylphosphatase
MTVKKRMLIKGKKVHNVGYRPLLMEKAQELKILNFHAKNVKEDGWQVVDVRVGGEEERIDSFLKFARKNSPESAEVDNISVLEYEDDIMTLEEYSKVFSALQLSKIAQAGLGMIEMQKQTLGKQDQTLAKQDSMLDKQDETITIIKTGNELLATKQDQMLGKQDVMIEKQDVMIEKQDVMIDKQDETISIIKNGVDEMREFRTETQQNFATLDTKYGKVGENMERILEEMKEERKESRESMEKILNAILKLVEKSGR